MEITVRTATKDDLNKINRIIEAAVMTWDLPERVKRLTIPTYKYNEMDLDHMAIIIAEQGDSILGVAGWEQANPIDAPKNHTALMLHGIYVNPEQQRQGIGTLLFQAAEKAAHLMQLDGVVVKAQKGSEGFYTSQGMTKLSAEDKKREFENRYWKRSK